MTHEMALHCARCLRTLVPGDGNFWFVEIEAVADPYPPEFTEEDLQRDARREISKLVRDMEDLSPQEAMDQVHRHTVVHLCNRCFEAWIEDPAR